MASITKAKLNGPGVVGKLGHIIDFELTIPALAWLAAGNPIDLSDWFSEITNVTIGGASEIIAGYKFGVIIPGDGVAVTSTNVLLTAHYSTDAAGAMTPVPNDTDLSSIVGLRMSVTGKIAATKY